MGQANCIESDRKSGLDYGPLQDLIMIREIELQLFAKGAGNGIK